jgi:tRNA modification GTPase
MASLRRLRRPADGALLDDALVLSFAAPRSETGEDMVELHVHGGRAVIAAVLAELGKMPGLRLAEPGEFTRRSFENGKLDLLELEGLADLIAAETEAQRAQAISVATGAQSALYAGWRDALLRALAFAEASLDFADEADVAADSYDRSITEASALAAAIADHLEDGHRGEILREGFRVVLAGPPNVGKSSLLNAIARREVAIVSPEAGTTRDALEVRLDLGGYPVILTDTAGLRAPEGPIEAEGIRRSLGHMREAELVLWLVEATGGPAAPPAEARADVVALTVITKADLVCRPVAGLAPTTLRVSARSGQGVDALIRTIGDAASRRLQTPAATSVITRERHRLALTEALEAMRVFSSADRSHPELGVEELRRAAHAFGRLTGRIGVEEVLGEIFGKFCIGK